MHKIDLNEKIERGWDERAQLLEEVRLKLRRGWRNDPEILQEYFRACVVNWKAYTGEKPEKVIAKLYGLYKQAVFGDCNEIAENDWTSLASKKYTEWKKLRGTSADEAKRRFLTYLAEFNPLLIDVMPNEVPPEGFPVDNKGQQICAKCNTKVGCHRPLMDQHGTILRRQLFEMEELHEIDNLRQWVQNALSNQRCLWGVHKPITRVESKKFTEWFNRSENLGYYMYDSSSVMQLIRDLLQLHCEITHDMQTNKTEYLTEEINKQTIKTFNLHKYYTELTGLIFYFEVDCTRDVLICNELRKSEGKNHKHVIELEEPVVDYSLHEIAVKLRKQCQELGIDPRTGVEKDILKRCEIYRERIKEFYLRQKKANESKERNTRYPQTHREQKMKIKLLSEKILNKHILNACSENNVEKILSLCERGVDMNVETPRGIRPLLCLIINHATTVQMTKIIQSGALIDTTNRYGMSPLMLACRLKDSRTIHLLMKSGAHELITTGYQTNPNLGGRSALHYCVLHTSEEEIRILTDYCLEGGEDALRVVRFLDQQDHNGDTPLILAARYRNGICCRLLLSLGANPNIRNKQKRIAAYVARSSGHRQLADWLDTKISTGISQVETYSDLNFEKNLRYSNMKIKEYLMNFCKLFLKLLQNKTSSHFITSPSQIQAYLFHHSERGLSQQSMFINRYFHHFILKNQNFSFEIQIILDEMKKILQIIVAFLREGICYPSVETEEKPLPFTPLMCACVMNDLRSIRLIYHEGGESNHCNKYGMTPLMLCALLQNTESLCELLNLGGDINLTDNEGYTALAYATALPLPLPLYRTTSTVILNGQNEGTKRWSSETVLKLSLTHSCEELCVLVQENIQKSQGVPLENELKQMKLLESNGLSHIETMDDFLAHYAGITWRVEEAGDVSSYLQSLYEGSEGNHENESENEENIFGKETSSDAGGDTSGDKQQHQHHGHYQLTEIDQMLQSHKEQVRCPICTLPIPCKHFFRPQTVFEYHEKKGKKKNNFELESKNEILQKTKQTTQDLKFKISKMKYNKMIDKVLIEAELVDRQTNRNLQYVKKYSKRMREEKRGKGEGEREEREEGKGVREIENDKDSDSEKGSVDQEEENQQNEERVDEEKKRDLEETLPITVPLPLPVIHKVAKPVLKKNPNNQTRKYKPHRRVIKFSIESKEGQVNIVDGGVEEGDETISISTYDDSLQLIPSTDSEINTVENTHDSTTSSPTPDPTTSTPTSEATPVGVSEINIVENSVLYEEKIEMEKPPLKLGHYTPDQEEVVLSSIRLGKRQHTPLTPTITLKIGSNPINLTRRYVNMFKETVSQSTLLTPPPSSSSLSTSSQQSQPPPSTVSSSDPSRTHHPKKNLKKQPPSSSSSSSSSNNSPPLLTYPGWIFTGIYPIDLSYNPYGLLSLPMISWGLMIQKLSYSLISTSFYSFFQLFSLVHTNSWKISNSSCQACLIGIIRHETTSTPPSIDTKTETAATVATMADVRELFPPLCMACLYRKFLYAMVNKTFGKDIKMTKTDQSRDNIWPFHLHNSTGDSNNHNTHTPPIKILTLFDFDSNDVDGVTAIATDTAAFTASSSSLNLEGTQGLTRGDSFSSLQLPLIPSQKNKNKTLMKTYSNSLSQTFPKSKLLIKQPSATHLSPRSRLFSPPSSPPGPLENKKKSFDPYSTTQPTSRYFDEEESLHTINSSSASSSSTHISSLTMNTLTSSSCSTLTTINSNNSNSNISTYGPKELTLLPILIIQRNYDEIERIIRIAIQKSEYGTEEGISFILKLILYQIETFKLMGLWSLSMCLLFDVIDWCVSRVGYDHQHTFLLLNLLYQCCYLTRQMEIYERYWEDLRGKLKKYADCNERKMRILTAVEENYREYKVSFMKLHEPYLESQSHPGIPSRYIWKTLYFISGYGGFYQFFFSVQGEFFPFQQLFLQFSFKFSNNISQICHFCFDCLQLQHGMIDEVIKLQINQIYKKYISKKLQYLSTNPTQLLTPTSFNNEPTVLSLYHQHITKINKKKMIEFIQMGTVLPKDFFLPMLKPSLSLLLPLWRAFLHTTHGRVFCHEILQLEAEYLHCNLVTIQNKWRVSRAKERVRRLKEGGGGGGG